MAQGMARRHLFDNGFPVTNATLIAGGQVLLAVANESLRRSDYRLAKSFLLLASSSQRAIDSRAQSGCTRVELRDSRDNFNYGNAGYAAGAGVPAGVGLEPGELPACEAPHQP